MNKSIEKKSSKRSEEFTKKAIQIYNKLRQIRPVTKQDLKNYIRAFINIDIPDKRLCPGHASPLDYLWYSYNADFAGRANPNADAIVWANRGGGKTQLAAVATLLDCIFKPKCQVRILGGSGEQSSRMYGYLQTFLLRGFTGTIQKPVLKEKCRFTNGSSVEVLTQSPTSVRGVHVQKLRCDEVELFDPDVFEAAKFVTQSKDNIKAAMEIVSTVHKPYGLMQKIIDDAEQNQTPIFKWCLWETIERCVDRSCSRCPLDNYCQGKAKQAAGYLKIDDCITQLRRASTSAFETEMLCKRPSLQNVVFDQFDPDIHVRPVGYNPLLPLYRAIDFGFTNPFVCLWIQADDTGMIRVIDEYVKRRVTIEVHAEEIKKRTPCPEHTVSATCCDPAGAACNDVTGTSAVRELRTAGIATHYRKSEILTGIELIRRAVRNGAGQTHLMISPKCRRLIEAMRCYHYPDKPTESELPEKDGVHDHPIDALRYFFVNVNRTAAIRRRY